MHQMANQKWLDYLQTAHNGEKTNISWAAYHASRSDKRELSDVSALLPLWRDSSKLPAMIKHSLNIVRDAVAFLNPGQTPVIAFGQPLFALAKKIQWHHPNCYGNFVVMMGPLHTEMAFMSVIGDLLEDSGWNTILTNARVVRPGVSEALVSAHDVVRTKYSHQVTVAVLFQLRNGAYKERSENMLNFSFNALNLKGPPQVEPTLYETAHIPKFLNQKRNCKVCYASTKKECKIYSYCSAPQCGVYLHCTAAKNCFDIWHKKDYHR